MKTGILLMNTGTPDAPTVEAIRPYLTEFLMDPAIIGAPLFIRKPLVRHIVARRPERTASHYQAFWTPEGSPFMIVSRRQRDLLQESLNGQAGDAAQGRQRVGSEEAGQEMISEVVQVANEEEVRVAEGASASQAGQGDSYQVEIGMRYGNPSIRSGLELLRGGACERVVLVPFYPQNVNVCAGTCLLEARDQLADLAKAGWNPEVREVLSFHDQPAYRDALAKSVANAWTYAPGSKLVVSFHSTMMRDIERDDTYLVQDTQTKDWLAEALGVPSEDAILSFQSRFDSRKWLQPFTEQVLLKLLDDGVQDICVVCPGFVADNIETMIEVNEDLRSVVETGKPVTKVPGHVAHNREEVILEVERKAKFTYVPALGTDLGLIEAVRAAIDAAL